MTCQWCDAPKNDSGICLRGCFERAAFTNRCIDCNREFQTGWYGADQCPRCRRIEDARHQREAEGDAMPHTGYGADRRRASLNRRCLEMKDPAERERERQRIREAIRLDVDAGEPVR